MKRTYLLAGAAVVVAVVAIVIAITMTRPSTPSASSSQSTGQAAAQTATITYSGSGFSPASVTVASGATITIKNTDDTAMQLASDPHPTHTDDPDLNVGLVEPGQSKTFTVTQKGSYGYHNHLDPGDKGKIVIE